MDIIAELNPQNNSRCLEHRNRIAGIKSADRPDPELSQWQSAVIPDDDGIYPENIRVYLQSDGTGLEVTPEIITYAGLIRDDPQYPGTDTYKGLICAVVNEIDQFEYTLKDKQTGFVTELPDIRTAQEVLDDRACICAECARLACAVLRSLNIPSRTVTSFVGMEPYDHTWIQVYIPDFGWIDVDPEKGECPKDLERLTKPYALIDIRLTVTHVGTHGEVGRVVLHLFHVLKIQKQ